MPISLWIPSTRPAFAKLKVILQAVVTAIEEIFAVQLYYGEDGEEEMEHWLEMEINYSEK